MKKRRHARARGSARVLIPLALGIVLLTGGGAYAAYQYDQSTSERIMPGVEIAGVHVGDMAREEALAAVNEVAADRLDRDLEIRAADKTWHVTPAELGTTADVEAKVDAALAVGEEYSWPARVLHRAIGRSTDRSFDLAFTQDDAQIERFVQVVGRAVHVSPRNAAVDLVEGDLKLTKPKEGRALKGKQARAALAGAIENGAGDTELVVKSLKPKVTQKKLGHTIVVRLSENKLYLYKGLKLDRSYPVATGSPGFATPKGKWNIWAKRENPTWTNPAPNGWGKTMPKSIPGGPNNPLGTRALYLDAPGIRIHGTNARGSIGTYASHGCIRMLREHVEELYEIVDVNTQVLIV